ncbi:MAG: sigma-70 family RNA polymerase sigma factor [Geminicoccaceae bacterium]|nr:sigma-70 family RNA polymerase sigma factor [Geminicoccaceae bacterium]
MSVFREDVAELMPQLRAFARSLTSGDGALADDLVQDAVLNAMQAERQFTPGTNLKAWMFTILRNRFFSLRTRKHVSSEIASDELESLAWIRPEQESRIEVTAFKRAFAALNAAQREVLVLTVIHGLPYDEVARICGCEVGTVKSRVNRARVALKKMLLDEALPVAAQKTPIARFVDRRMEADAEHRRRVRASYVPQDGPSVHRGVLN